ncbi:MAG: hypothetical protein QXQ46_06260 [Thermoplasmatales archaeon]
MVENAKQNGKIVQFTRSVSRWENIVNSGEDVPLGSVLLRTGSVIDPRTVGVLYATGTNMVKVFRKVKIGVASSGNELIFPNETISPEKIYESNSTYVMSELSLLRNVAAKQYGLIHDDIK